LTTRRYYPSEKERPPTASANGAITNEKQFLNLEVNLSQIANIPKVIRPGNHEFPFEFTLSGDTAESIEGMYGDHITYSMKAVIEKGVLAKDLIARRHMRVIRTLGHDSLELQDPQVDVCQIMGRYAANNILGRSRFVARQAQILLLHILKGGHLWYIPYNRY